jgi:hypothetical protein
VEDVYPPAIEIFLWSKLQDKESGCYKQVKPIHILETEVLERLPIPEGEDVLFQDIDGNMIVTDGTSLELWNFLESSAFDNDVARSFFARSARTRAWDRRISKFLPLVLEFIERNGGHSAWIGKEADAVYGASKSALAMHYLESDYGLYLTEVLHATLKDRGAIPVRPFRPHRERPGNWWTLAKPFQEA